MTQHIEPAAWMWTDSTGCVHMAGDRPDIYTAAATVAQLPEPLYDAAALAAAEERGRIEERELCAKERLFSVLASEMKCRKWLNDLRGYRDAFDSACAEAMNELNRLKQEAYSLGFAGNIMRDASGNRVNTLSTLHAITKEPTP